MIATGRFALVLPDVLPLLRRLDLRVFPHGLHATASYLRVSSYLDYFHTYFAFLLLVDFKSELLLQLLQDALGDLVRYWQVTSG